MPILGRLALEMHREWPTGVAPEGFIVNALAKAIQEREGTSDKAAFRSAREFLKRAGEEVQILLKRGADQWGFLHLTFQEFFAAIGLHAAEMFFEERMAHLFEARWEEVLRLGVGYMALVQNRPEGVRRFIQSTLDRKESGKRRFITEVLRKQIPLAALFAVEAGDSLPATLQDKVATAFCEWLCAMPESIGAASFGDALLSEFANRLIQPLMRLAQSDQPTVRAQAIDYLCLLKALGASSLITAALRDEAPQVRAAAAWAVKAMRLASAVSALEGLLSDPDVHVKVNAAFALIALRPEQAGEIVRGWQQKKDSETEIALRVVVPSLKMIPAIAPLVEEVFQSGRASEGRAETDVAVMRDAASQASTIVAGHVDLSDLIEESRDDDPAVRFVAASGLMHWKSPASISRLVSLLDDPSQEVRRMAAWSLGSFKAEEAIEPLVHMASSSDASERNTALNALWTIASI